MLSTDWRINISIRKKKMPLNLLNADNRDWKANVSMEKEKNKATESVGGRQKRLANQRQYEKEKCN